MEERRLQDLNIVLGTGTYGQVKLYYDRHRNEQVAVKEIRIPGEYALRESDLLNGLLHDNIIYLYGSRQVGSFFHLVMPYYPRGDLGAFCRANRPSERLVRCWTRQLVDLLKYLREKRTLHRDLKPSNILLADLEADEPIVVCDFGISIAFDSSLSAARSVVGTLPYMAPEVFNSDQYTYSADVWSLGVTVYELLFQVKPFSTEKDICTAPLLFPEHPPVSDAAKAFLTSVLNKSPEDRPYPEELLTDPFCTQDIQEV